MVTLKELIDSGKIDINEKYESIIMYCLESGNNLGFTSRYFGDNVKELISFLLLLRQSFIIKEVKKMLCEPETKESMSEQEIAILKQVADYLDDSDLGEDDYESCVLSRDLEKTKKDLAN